MKKKTMVGLAVAAGVTLLTAGVALAESPTLRGHLFGKDASTLTETQKTDVQTYQDKLAQLKKDFYATMVKDGTLTQAEADAAIAKIESDLASGTLLDGLADEGHGKGGRMEERGFAMMDTSKLTDAQKADLKTVTDKIVANENARLAKMVELKVLTQAQADSQLKVLADMTSRTDAGIGACLGGMRFGDLRDVQENTTLTDTQKTALAVFDTQAASLRKELADKLVKLGLLTQTQADAMANMHENGHGGMMKDGMMGGRGHGEGRGFGNNSGDADGDADESPGTGATGGSTVVPSASGTSTGL